MARTQDVQLHSGKQPITLQQRSPRTEGAAQPPPALASRPHALPVAAAGIKNWGRVPALNTNPAFIDDLADAVMEALPYVGCLAGPTDSLVPLGEAGLAGGVVVV